MGWIDDQFFYSKRLLRRIAENYPLSDGLPMFGGQITNPWAIAEYKADFDIALNSLGKGKWEGAIRDFKYYRNFGRLQRIVIAEVIGMEDDELVGFYDVPRLRSYAYYLMTKRLNEEVR